MGKEFKLSKNEIKELISAMGGCIASDRITIEGKKVGYMYREEPTDLVSSGWTFMSGDEDQDYADDADNWSVYEVNTICNYDPSILPFVNSPIGSAYGRDRPEDEFKREPL